MILVSCSGTDNEYSALNRNFNSNSLNLKRQFGCLLFSSDNSSSFLRVNFQLQYTVFLLKCLYHIKVCINVLISVSLAQFNYFISKIL